MAQVPYYWLYATRPDGQRLRGGDTYLHSTRKSEPWDVGHGTVLTASYYGDGMLLQHADTQGGVRDNEALFEFLWRDPKLQPKPANDLPLSRYFPSPFGWMIARTGWGDDAVVAEMKVNVYNFSNHQHLDAGAFQIYYRGALAIDSGVYKGSSGQYGSPHCRNYYWRTVAHNSLLIYDPREEFNTGGGYLNDGGQRLPNGRSEPGNLDVLLDPKSGYHTGEVLAQGFGPDSKEPDYTYLRGDITAAYSEKVKLVERSFVFLNLKDVEVPAAMIVYDIVVSANPEFKKYWLLHSMEEPQMTGSQAVIQRSGDGNGGSLAVSALLPAKNEAVWKKVGGPGKEFLTLSGNYPNDNDPNQIARSSMQIGAWRLELFPVQGRARDEFLVVMQTTDGSGGKAFPTRRFETGDFTGCRIDGPERTWLTLFPRDAGLKTSSFDITVTDTRAVSVLVTGLAEGRWTAAHRSSGGKTEAVVTEETQAGWFEGAGGTWKLTMQEE